MNRTLLFLGFCIALLSASCAHRATPNPPFSSFRVILTSGLTEADEPLDRRDHFSLSDEAIYVYITWFDVNQDVYPYRLELHDGSGELVSVHKMDFRPTTDSWNSWSWYKIKEYVDAPGKWRLTVFLFDEIVHEQPVLVDGPAPAI